MARDTIGRRRLPALAAVKARLDAVRIAGKPLTWFVSSWRLYGLLLILAILYPQFYGNQGQLLLGAPNEALVIAGIFVGIYVLLALGLNIVVGYAGLLDLGYVAFFVLGAYTVGVFTDGRILASDGEHAVLFQKTSFWLVLALAMIAASLAGILLGAPTLRLRGDYLAIVTLGFGEILPIFFQNVPWFGRQDGLSAVGPPDIGSITFSNPIDNIPFYYLTLLLVVVTIFTVKLLRDSSVGRAWVAIREDETAAAASGVNLVRTKLLAFALGALFGGVGGALYAASTGTISSSNFSFQTSIFILVMIVLGGIGNIAGVILGAVLLEFFDVYLLGQINDNVHNSPLVAGTGAPLHFLAGFDFGFSKYLIYGFLLLIMILLRPQGLLPDTRRRRELKGIGASVEGASALGLLEREEAESEVASVIGASDLQGTEYAGAGSDAQGREG
jgi:ABC-type branched-subunit amino acid transport system permease subunit